MMFSRNKVDPFLSKLTTDDDRRVVIWLYRKMAIEGNKGDYFSDNAHFAMRHVDVEHRKGAPVTDYVENIIVGLPQSGKSAEAALAELSFSKRRIAGAVKKALESAIANAENNHQLDVDRLYVAEASVGKAFVMKRFRPRARGRVGRPSPGPDAPWLCGCGDPPANALR